MTEIMFETFNVPNFYVCITAVLALYASGRTKGVVLNSGYDVTHSVPIDDYCLPNAVTKLNLAGRHITEHLSKQLLFKLGSSYLQANKIKHETIRDIKEKICHIALNCEEELELEQKYELPDGQVFTVGYPEIQAPECLFKPDSVDIDQDGINRLIFSSINKCDIDIRKDLFENIVVTGGSTMYQGFAERLLKEIKYLSDDDSYQYKIIAPPERKYSVFIGGSILASLSTFEEMWITKEAYDEE
eukprot:370503_1